MITSHDRGPAVEQYGGDDENQLSAEDTLIERGTDDLLDEGYSPPERPWRGASGSLRGTDQMLAAEEPDPAARLYNVLDDESETGRNDDVVRDVEFPERAEVGRARAGRLIAPDMGFGEDDEADLIADDVGVSGGAASAEEAAVHIIEDD
ncbi:DUF5709 domain-containing protein [Mycolicibacterium elephantis]|uniref:DUF5709 domain-containing protein n=1 Tax=Mycolicibacterium elephantis TaxID=81858 RepID=UPI0007E92DB1|nr:DUF5709 domain-containing protein [Mycolicibacterium elephantis]OBA69810.1 hypothetical protein A5633_24555 [Mycolicibacterium elephantis]